MPVSHSASRPQCSLKEDQPSCFYYEAASSPSKNSKLVIFAHGLFSTLASTWGDLAKDNSWPALLRTEKRFENFDVYLMNYPSACLNSGPNIHETAKNELTRLARVGVFDQYNEIYFVAHSMGGLVVKSLLTLLNHPHQDDILKLRKVKAAVFLGTPSQGAKLARLGKLFCRNPQLRDMEPSSLNTWLSTLDDHWTMLMNDRGEGQYPKAFCAFETKDEYNLNLVVPREAANARCDDLAQGLALNHSDLAVPTSTLHDPYFWVMNKIEETSTGIKPQTPTVSTGADDAIIMSAECEDKPIPKTIPSDGNIRGITFWPKEKREGMGGLDFYYLVPGVPTVPIWANSNTGYGHVCQITNHGIVTASDITITIGLRFKELIKDGPGHWKFGPTKLSTAWPLSITKVNPGFDQKFIFYISNPTLDLLEVSMPEYIELRGLRELKQRRVQLFHHTDLTAMQYVLPTVWPPKEQPTIPR